MLISLFMGKRESLICRWMMSGEINQTLTGLNFELVFILPVAPLDFLGPRGGFIRLGWSAFL